MVVFILKDTLKHVIMDFNELKKKAEDFANDPKVKETVEKGKEYVAQGVAKGKDWIENGKGKEYLDKGKEALAHGKDKLEDFVSEKTDGKGVLGFGKKE